MTIADIAEKLNFKIINEGEMKTREAKKVFCCDLLSLAMSKLPADAAWVTVMGNTNTLAVASLADAACIITAENVCPDQNTVNKAKEQNITVLKSEFPVFETALMIDKLINA